VNDVYLGIIALGVLVMAITQVAAVVVATRASRRMGDVVSRLEQDVRPIVVNLQEISAEARPILANLQTIVTEARPIVANLQTMAADAARATSVAATQIDRAERLMGDFVKRVDSMVSSLQARLLKPARQGFAVMQGIKAALSAFRDRAPRAAAAPRQRGATVEEEDALFIG
jgi:hypothetical protein